MTVEQLMKPRYEVMLDYPKSDYKVGSIIEMEDEKQVWFTGELDWVSKPQTRNGNKVQVSIKQFEPYSAIFCRLFWWERREESEMPRFVKNKDGNVYEVVNWEKYLGAFIFQATKYVLFCNISARSQDYTPATEEEYLDFINKPS